MGTKQDTKSSPPWLAFCQLVRLPNVFTVISNVTMGYAFVYQNHAPLYGLVPLLVSSIALYWAGMVMNDVCDFGIDQQQRPERPLPSGRFSLDLARKLAWWLLIGGVVVGAAAGLISPWAGCRFRSGVIALVLAAVVWAYNQRLKHTPIGVLAMGACRFFNVLLGMSLSVKADGPSWLLSFDSSELLVACAIGVYVVGVSIIAKSEAEISSRRNLTAGLLVMIAGLAMLAAFPKLGNFITYRQTVFSNDYVWPLLILLLAFSVVRRVAEAIVQPKPAFVQEAVKLSIFTMIVLDASLALATQGPFVGVAILALLIPANYLGQYIYST
ncbi:MAG: UbiA family prenyltransferase [Planctomycetales bacterium]|nr:UbiA family prenyltransferase [Planctomycetales bacterium]